MGNLGEVGSEKAVATANGDVSQPIKTTPWKQSGWGSLTLKSGKKPLEKS